MIASPTMTDAAGRSGIAVSFVGDIDQYDLIFEPQTCRFPGWQVVPKPKRLSASPRSEVILSVTIVDPPVECTYSIAALIVDHA
ncbi:hypothetical protein [Micromonospora sp. WMMD737]|uniref:hypothetical protein n=1 Tax=Micromonospora sp. WMMD737 TaxID=3404113 RepID=UPI003B922C7A